MQLLSIALLLIVSLFSHRCYALQGVDLVFVTNPDTPRAALLSPNIEKVAGQIAEKFTVCLWAKIQCSNDQGFVNLVSYYSKETEQSNEILLEAHCMENYTSITIGGKAVTVNPAPPFGRWTHLCVSYDSTVKEVTFYFDGRQVGPKVSGPGVKIGRDGFLELGQDQDSKDGGYDVSTGLNGRMTRVHMWDRVLSDVEVRLVYKCQLKGNVIEWESSIWTMANNLMVLPTTMTNCPSPNCVSLSITPKTCQKPTEVSSYDLTSTFTPHDNHNNVRVILKTPKVNSDLEEFSFCFRVYYNEPRTYPIFPFAYLKGDSQEIVLGFWNRRIYVRIGNKAINQTNKFPRESWNHICVTWSGLNKGKTIIYLNGNEEGTPAYLRPEYVVPGMGDLYLTQDQLAPLNSKKPAENFNMKITGVGMWKRPLTKNEVENLYECDNAASTGQIVSPNNAAYELTV